MTNPDDAPATTSVRVRDDADASRYELHLGPASLPFWPTGSTATRSR